MAGDYRGGAGDGVGGRGREPEGGRRLDAARPGPNPKFETRNPKPQTPNQKPET